MISKELLDTNKIIEIVSSKEKYQEWLKEISSQSSKIFFTTPLIRHEVLRFYTNSESDLEQYQRAEQLLSILNIINIDNAITNIATDIVRYEKSEYPERYRRQVDGTEKRIDKYNFDIMYVATAKCFNLVALSNDGDIPKLMGLYDEMKTKKEW